MVLLSLKGSSLVVFRGIRMTLTKPTLPGVKVIKLERHEVIKHSAAIHISNTLTHTQRMVSNVLLKNSFKDLLSNDRHKLKVSTLV